MAFLDIDDNCMAIADSKWKMLDEREKNSVSLREICIKWQVTLLDMV
jgi:hypothetical protein